MSTAEMFADTFDPMRGQKKYSWEFKNSHEYQMLRHLMAHLLQNPLGKKWTTQGLGMMRCYLDTPYNNFRVNVWDHSLRTENVSSIHTHPWDFISWVLSGQVRNTRYVYADIRGGNPYNSARLKCGKDGALIEQSEYVRDLQAMPTECYTKGDVYWQGASEIHETNPASASVTVNFRREVRGGNHEAFVFWPNGTNFVSARPRDATRDEIERVCTRALANWDVFEPGYTAD